MKAQGAVAAEGTGAQHVPASPTRGGRGARVLKRLQHLQNTQHFSRVQAQPGNSCALLKPRNPARAEKTVTLNPRRRGSAAQTLERGRKVLSEPHLTLPQHRPPPPPIPTEREPFPRRSENSSQLQSGGRTRVTPIQLPKWSFLGTACFVLRTSTHKTRDGFLKES